MLKKAAHSLSLTLDELEAVLYEGIKQVLKNQQPGDLVGFRGRHELSDCDLGVIQQCYLFLNQHIIRLNLPIKEPEHDWILAKVNVHKIAHPEMFEEAVGFLELMTTSQLRAGFTCKGSNRQSWPQKSGDLLAFIFIGLPTAVESRSSTLRFSHWWFSFGSQTQCNEVRLLLCLKLRNNSGAPGSCTVTFAAPTTCPESDVRAC
jgi:hypothetical protein